MDIDSIEENEQQPGRQSATTTPITFPVDDDHPFDLEAYISAFKGRAVLDRLIHIIPLAPSLALQAVQIALQQLPHIRDVNLYRSLRAAYDRAIINSHNSLPPTNEVIPLDQKWIDETTARNTQERVKLEVELKTYTSNMIKESIRMGHRDLAEFYRQTGDFQSALKHYTKSREFCTTSQHVLDMCLSVLELLIEQRNYAHMSTYIFKADSALDALTVVRPPPPVPGERDRERGARGAEVRVQAQAQQMQTQAQNDRDKERKNAERERTQSKLDVATALSNLGQGNFDKAATTFVKVGSVKSLEDWAEKIISPSEIATYTTLCALATLDRPALRPSILDNDSFGVFIEQEPYLRELLEAYLGNRFKAVLEILERNSTRHALSPHLFPHLTALTNQIRARALVLYFRPFAAIRLDRMSAAFGWEMDELERMLVVLIGKGEIDARVDRTNMILKAKETDQRAALFARIIKAGETMQSTNRKLLLRMRLQQADLVIKSSKGIGSSGFGTGDYHMSF